MTQANVLNLIQVKEQVISAATKPYAKMSAEEHAVFWQEIDGYATQAGRILAQANTIAGGQAQIIVKRFTDAAVTVFTLAMAEEYRKIAEARGASRKGRQALAWLRKSLRANNIEVKTDPRGSRVGEKRNNGDNGKTVEPDNGKTVEPAPKMPSIFDHIEALRIAGPADLATEDGRMFLHYLSMVERQEKAKLSSK